MWGISLFRGKPTVILKKRKIEKKREANETGRGGGGAAACRSDDLVCGPDELRDPTVC